MWRVRVARRGEWLVASAWRPDGPRLQRMLAIQGRTEYKVEQLSSVQSTRRCGSPLNPQRIEYGRLTALRPPHTDAISLFQFIAGIKNINFEILVKSLHNDEDNEGIGVTHG